MFLGNEGQFYPGSSNSFNYGEKIRRGEIKMIIDTVKGEISFVIERKDYGVAI